MNVSPTRKATMDCLTICTLGNNVYTVVCRNNRRLFVGTYNECRQFIGRSTVPARPTGRQVQGDKETIESIRDSELRHFACVTSGRWDAREAVRSRHPDWTQPPSGEPHERMESYRILIHGPKWRRVRRAVGRTPRPVVHLRNLPARMVLQPSVRNAPC